MTDPRTGPKDSGTVQITSGDGNTPQTALNNRNDSLFRPEEIKISYDSGATVNADVTIFDDADGTSAGEVSDDRDRIENISPGSEVSVTYSGVRDIEEDVLVQTDGNQDSDIEVTVQGTRLIALDDVMEV